MAIDDIYTDGIASGWRVRDASLLTQDLTLEADVAIVGSGAGGGTAAEILSAAGLRVLILEEGPLQTARDFRDMNEARAYATLYQEGAGRASSDGALQILQGRAVGGTTTVNWTSSFRTPPETLKHWAGKHGVRGASVDEMAPWFQRMEERLGVAPWAMAPNANNAVLRDGAQKLDWEWHVIPRNVRGCWNLGYCGVGCPTNAKQSMLVTTIPQALRQGAELVHHLRVQTLRFEGGRVAGLDALALMPDTLSPSGVRVTVRARHYVLSGGSINTPALLLRSRAPDPHGQTGAHTCVHPVVLSLAEMPQKVDGYYGAPQSIASDHFQWKDGATGAAGFKMEVPPMMPALVSTMFGRFGGDLKDEVSHLPRLNAALALMRDGFVDDAPGGQVRIDEQGNPLLDYDIGEYLWHGMREAYRRMAELQFAAGATRVRQVHLDARWTGNPSDALRHVDTLQMKKFRTGLFSAHLMGGCAMGSDPKNSVTDSNGRHHQLENLHVFDGSLFPTSIGANPQLSIYALVAKHATRLAGELARKDPHAV
ncbi:GMC family oxidoreductase [Solimonas sp. K1W22B-7]|uniref:GMC family oxidoreductase n=1 Tax=Solimonas sp. K1W22B-7 TaxID=2303331 RepID=UPI000E3322EE|nr:GMC family oxidoreductase [Solimonas sp. K1W22B-7]AXQ30795.1 GMC family oxidoreductase [Solimonas sp. K1W22B-7]